jgi:hypothetical protein
MKRILMTGNKYGRLTIEKEIGKHVNCLCDCGNRIEVRRGNVLAGYTKSCGCLRAENTSKANIVHGACKDYKRSKEYRIWRGMWSRCTNPQRSNYKWYGAKGIQVCAAWKSFANFLIDMGKCPKGFEIDRINNRGNYEPGNCRWTSHRDNCNNK